MIKQRTIDEVLDLSLIDVIGREIELKRSGATHKGVCPFHDDNGPSLMVSQSKNIYKCFACGAGGNNGVKYVMERHSMSFPEAIKHLANNHQIIYEEDETKIGHNLPKPSDRDIQERLLSRAQSYYKKELSKFTEISAYLHERGISDDLIQYFGIGYAGTDFGTIKNQLVKEGNLEQGVKIGIVSENPKGFHDTFVGRITIPIYDPSGRLLTFGGRDNSGKYAKYINGKDSWLYNKDKVLFNLNEAKSEIKSAKFVYLCEGYFDVIGLARIGVGNAVANCGTAFTASQAKLIKRFTPNVVIWYDGDKAGMNATHATAKILIQEGLNVSVLNMLGQDPDDYSLDAFKQLNLEIEKYQQENPDNDIAAYQEVKLQKLQMSIKKMAVHFLDWAKTDLVYNPKEYIIKAKKDDLARVHKSLEKLCTVVDLGSELMVLTKFDISPFLQNVKYTVSEDALNAEQRNEQRQHFLQLLKLYPDAVQEEYYTSLAKEWKITKSTISKATKNAEDIIVTQDRHVEEDVKRIPKGIDNNFYFRNGFAPAPDHSGYFFIDANGGFTKAANFTIKPLFHIYGEDNKRYVEVRKGEQVMNLLLDSVCFSSVDMLDKALWNEGGLVASTMSKQQFNLLREYWGDKFPKCYELTKLGHQDEGFFAFCNQVYNGKLTSFNDLGIYEHEKRNYLSPSITESLKDLRGSENIYENDKYLEYKMSPVTAEAYFKQFKTVFGEHAYYGIPFIFLTIFRDVALKKGKIPFLYNYGPTQMGKSSFSECILHFFFSGKDSQGQLIKPLQIGSCTDYAFFQSMERYQNVPAIMNELDAETTPYERILSLKGVFDGEGRAKGSGIKNKTIRQRPNTSIILVGQYLVNVDDNSLVNRSIIRYFPKKEFTQQEVDDFTQLADWNKEGVSSLVTEIYRHREEVARRYDSVYPLTVSRLRTYFKSKNKMVTARLIDNYAHLLAFTEIMNDFITLPFTYDEMWENLTAHVIEHNKLLESSDIISSFWGFVEFLIRERIIKIGYDVKVEGVDTISIYKDGQETDKKLDRMTSVLYIQASAVHKKYAANFTKTNKQSPMSESNLRKYLQDMPAYLGTCRKTTFKGHDGLIRTSAMMFDADKLEMDLSVYFSDGAEEANVFDIYSTSEPVIKTVLGQNILSFKAAVPTGIGERINYTCRSLDESALGKITSNSKITVEAKVTPKSFKSQSGEMIEYNLMEISKFIAFEKLESNDDGVFNNDDNNLPF